MLTEPITLHSKEGLVLFSYPLTSPPSIPSLSSHLSQQSQIYDPLRPQPPYNWHLRMFSMSGHFLSPNSFSIFFCYLSLCLNFFYLMWLLYRMVFIRVCLWLRILLIITVYLLNKLTWMYHKIYFRERNTGCCSTDGTAYRDVEERTAAGGKSKEEKGKSREERGKRVSLDYFLTYLA